ncbi:MAG: hypothetical protein JRJ39_15145 [Deltaproteobacteria bacterium]|nr:hypothetical protein [Deltaproteobacteria bacterium]
MISKDYKTKSLKNGTNYFRLTISSGRYSGICLKKNQDMIPKLFIASPMDFLYGNQVELLKDDLNSVRVIKFGDTCIKYNKRRSFRHALKAWMGYSRGRKSFHHALSMTDRFVATPDPFCYLEGKMGDSFYLSRFIPFSTNIVDYLREASSQKQQVCRKQLAVFLNKAFGCYVYHKDLKGSNILITDSNIKLQFHLIDTEDVAISRKVSSLLLEKSLLRITRSLVEFFDRQNLVEFVDACVFNLSVPDKIGIRRKVVNKAILIQEKLQLQANSVK